MLDHIYDLYNGFLPSPTDDTEWFLIGVISPRYWTKIGLLGGYDVSSQWVTNIKVKYFSKWG